MQTITQDLRYAFRSLKANPGFATVAVLMLALGIGANSTIFSWVNSVLLDPMPGSARTQRARAVHVPLQGRRPAEFFVSRLPGHFEIGEAGVGHHRLRRPVGRRRRRSRSRARLDARSSPRTSSTCSAYRSPLGRGFTAQEETPGAPATVVLSHAYWQRRFNGDAGVIGRQLKINSQPFTIVGVAAPGFLGAVSGLSYDMWLPVGTQPIVMPGGERLDRSRQPLDEPDRPARTGIDARAGAGRARFDDRADARDLGEPEPLHRPSRRRVSARQLAGRRHRRAAAGAC